MTNGEILNHLAREAEGSYGITMPRILTLQHSDQRILISRPQRKGRIKVPTG